MFKNAYQSGLLSVFYSCGSNPLAIWDLHVENGHIKRLTDSEVNSIVLEIVSTNVATTYISCPKNNKVLGIRLPFLVMIVKNLKRYFSFEITILDDKNMRRRFRISNFQSTTKIKPFCTSMPIGLSGGWNQIQFNLSDFTKRAYGSQFIEALRVQIHANVRLRRIYFCDRLYTEEELPQEYKLYLPLEKKLKKAEKEEPKPEPAVAAPPPPEAVKPTEPEQPAPAEVPAPAEEPVAVSEPVGSRKGSEVSVTPATTEGGAATETPLESEPAEGEEGGELPQEAEGEPAEGGADEAPAEAPAEVPTEEAPTADTEAPGEPAAEEEAEPPAEEPPAEAPPEEA